MKVGNLVKIKRATVGVPRGTLALVVEDHGGCHQTRSFPIFEGYMCGTPRHPLNKTRRYLEIDLEVIK